MIHLYDALDSGNGYKVRLLLRQLGRPFGWTDLDIFHGAARTPEFLAKNPNGRIPTLQLDDGSYLAESNAILWYLAEGSQFIPDSRLGRARVLQWMFFEHTPSDSPRRAELPARLATGRAALAVMEQHLQDRDYFVDDRYSIADIALYAYTHVAEEGGHDLAPYAAVRRWLARVAAQPRHVTITWVP
jgi:glutathione S-transferase